MQATRKCSEVAQLESGNLQVERHHPPWLENARIPVLVGGNIGFVVAYFVGLYTIFHVAQAYKKLDLKVSTASSIMSPLFRLHPPCLHLQSVLGGAISCGTTYLFCCVLNIYDRQC